MLHKVPGNLLSSVCVEALWKCKLDLTYDMEDEYPLENQSLIDIINLKQLHDLVIV